MWPIEQLYIELGFLQKKWLSNAKSRTKILTKYEQFSMYYIPKILENTSKLIRLICPIRQNILDILKKKLSLGVRSP